MSLGFKMLMRKNSPGADDEIWR